MSDSKEPWIAQKIGAETRAIITKAVGIALVVLVLGLVLFATLGGAQGPMLARYTFSLIFSLSTILASTALAKRLGQDDQASSIERITTIVALMSAAMLMALGSVSETLALAGLVGLLGIWLMRALSGVAPKAAEGGASYQPNQGAETVAGLLVAILGILVAYGFGLRAFQIPSGSMEPTLYGAEGSGERAIVNLSHSFISKPERGDITIFRYPLGRGQDYVKRNVAQGGDLVTIYAGDLYIQRAGEPRPTIWKKEGPVRESLWFNQLTFSGQIGSYSKHFGGIKGSAKESMPGGLILDPADSDEARFRYPKQGAFRNHDPSREPDPGRAELHNTENVLDARVRGTLTIPEGGEAEILFARTDGPVKVVLKAGSAPVVEGAKPSDENESIEVPSDEAFAFAIGVADGELSLVIAGQQAIYSLPSPLDAEIEIRKSAGTLEAFFEELGGPTFAADQKRVTALNALSMHIEVAARGAKVQLEGLKIDRDVHYLGRRKLTMTEQGPKSADGVSLPLVHHVMKDGYFMLGDHSEDSLDSRSWFEVLIEIDGEEYRFPLTTFFAKGGQSETGARFYVDLSNAVNRLVSEEETKSMLSEFERVFKAGRFGVTFEAKDIFGIPREIKASEATSLRVRGVHDAHENLIVGPLLGSVFPRPRFIH